MIVSRWWALISWLRPACKRSSYVWCQQCFLFLLVTKEDAIWFIVFEQSKKSDSSALFMENESMMYPWTQDQEVTRNHFNADPFVFHVPDVEVSLSLQNEPDLFVWMIVFSPELLCHLLIVLQLLRIQTDWVFSFVRILRSQFIHSFPIVVRIHLLGWISQSTVWTQNKVLT